MKTITESELKLEDMLFSVIFTREDNHGDDDPPCESLFGWKARYNG